MCESLCGAACHECSVQSTCNGCVQTNGRPSGKPCFIARYILIEGREAFEDFKKQLIDEINGLEIPGMPKIDDLFALNGRLVNLTYPLPSGQKVAFLDDDAIYLGNQLPCEFDESHCYGIVAGMDFIMVSSYEMQGTDPELIFYRKR